MSYYLEVEQQVALRAPVNSAVKRCRLSGVYLHAFNVQEVWGAH